jgi:hypothetical protein
MAPITKGDGMESVFLNLVARKPRHDVQLKIKCKQDRNRLHPNRRVNSASTIFGYFRLDLVERCSSCNKIFENNALALVPHIDPTFRVDIIKVHHTVIRDRQRHTKWTV